MGLFLHVGYPKTGSTSLQRHLFSRHPQIAYLGKPFDPEMVDWEAQVVAAGDVVFEGEVARLGDALRARLQAAAGPAPEGAPIVFSHEGFLRATRHGGHDVLRTAERLARVVSAARLEESDVRVLVCIRNQADLFLSHFVQFEGASQRALARRVEAAVARPRAGITGALFFDEVIEGYEKAFGPGRVAVELFEALRADAGAFGASLCERFGVDAETGRRLLAAGHERAKPRRGGRYLVEQRHSLWHRAGRVTAGLGAKRFGHVLKRRSREPVEMTAELRARLGAIFASSNRRLADAHALPLERYGYPLAPADVPGRAGRA